MVIAGIPIEEIRHTRAVHDWLAEGRQEGLQEGKAQEAAKSYPSPPQPPLRPPQRSHHRPDPGPTSGGVGSPGRLAGGKHLRRPL